MWILFLLFSVSVAAAPVKAPHVTVELVAENQNFALEKKLRAAFHWKIEPGWHLYWKNAGDSGEPPKITWKTSSVEEIQKFWPTPSVISVPPLKNYGYEKELTLVSELILSSEDLPKKLEAEAEWLVCKEECIPGRAELALHLPAQPQPELFKRTELLWPISHSPWLFKVKNEKDTLKLVAEGPSGFHRAYFFASDRSLFRHSEDQVLDKTTTGWSLKMLKKNTFPETLEKLEGVLVVLGKVQESFALDIPVEEKKSWLIKTYQQLSTFVSGLFKAKPVHLNWEKYSEEQIHQAVQNSEAVFVDFTADWCINCQVNEQVALNVDAVKKKFQEKKVRLFKADWTNQDPLITKQLDKYHHQGVPLYLFYPGDKKPVRVLPQTLTAELVLDELNK